MPTAWQQTWQFSALFISFNTCLNKNIYIFLKKNSQHKEFFSWELGKCRKTSWVCSAHGGQLQGSGRAIFFSHFTLIFENEPNSRSVFFYLITREGITRWSRHQDLGEMYPSSPGLMCCCAIASTVISGMVEQGSQCSKPSIIPGKYRSVCWLSGKPHTAQCTQWFRPAPPPMGSTCRGGHNT